MIVVLWAAIFLGSFLTAVLNDRRPITATKLMFLVAVIWSAIDHESLGLTNWTDVLISSFLVMLAGGLLGVLFRSVRRAFSAENRAPWAQNNDAPTTAGALERQD